MSEASCDTCGICRFYKATSDKSGDCRRFPPVWTEGEIAGFDVPGVSSEHWCGEFKSASTCTTSLAELYNAKFLSADDIRRLEGRE